MKQFYKILKFELLGYLKNKTFVGITLFLAIAIVIAMFVPNIISSISGDTDSPDNSGGSSSGVSTDGLPIMIIHSDNSELSELVCKYFKDVFSDYNVKSSNESLDEIKSKITNGEAECAFSMSSASAYTYYVNNLSMYDMNTSIADSVLQEVYRFSAMVEGGLTPDQAGEIMAVTISSATETLGKDQMQNFFYTYIMIFALYMVILLYGQMVATNVATEKSSRAMELLVTSAKPASMMFGKVLASCIAGLSQLIVVFGTALICFNINKTSLEGNMIMEAIFNIPFDLFIYMLIFFVLGFLIYAFLYGAIGSTASKLEDINTSVMPITFLFIFAFMVVIFSMTDGNVDNSLMRLCSYIPFTSPMAMFTRIAMSTVPFYEVAISIAILICSVFGVGILSAKIYRVGVLLYGKPPKFFNIIKTVLFKK